MQLAQCHHIAMLCTAYKYLTQSKATRQQAPLVVVHWTVRPLQALTLLLRAHHTLIMNYHKCQFVLCLFLFNQEVMLSPTPPGTVTAGNWNNRQLCVNIHLVRTRTMLDTPARDL